MTKLSIPYELIPHMQKFTGVKYDNKKKMWDVPESLIKNVYDLLVKYNYINEANELYLANIQLIYSRNLREELSSKVQLEMSSSQTIWDIINAIKIPENCKLYEYQEIGVAFLELAEGRALVGDEMGLGKTIQVLAWLGLDGEKKKTIWITKSKLVKQAETEIIKWLPDWNVQTITKGSQIVDTDNDIWVISYDLVEKQLAYLRKTGYKAVVMDEITMITNTSAKRTVAANALIENAKHIIGISGTPIRGRPKNFFSFLNMIQPKTFDSEFIFGRKFCGGYKGEFGWNFNGTSNPEILHEIIKPDMLRRTTADAAPHLPKKRKSFINIEPTKKFTLEYKKAEVRLNNSIMDYRKDGKTNAVFGALSRLRRLVGEEKAKQSKEIIEPYLEAGEKVILYVHHKSVRDKLMKDLKKWNPVNAGGDISTSRFNNAVEEFKTNPDSLVLVLSTLAGGSGLNITEACYGFFIERQWIPDDEDQAENRMLRIGQNRPVMINYMHIPNTIDDRIEELCEIKRNNTDMIMDGDFRNYILNNGVRK